MSAHERYSKFVGEIGINRLEYLYELTSSEMVLIERGYERRHRHLWSSSRWSTFYIMMATCGGKSLQESGIYRPSDLIRFPWDKTGMGNLTDEEIEDLQAIARQKFNEWQ